MLNKTVSTLPDYIDLFLADNLIAQASTDKGMVRYIRMLICRLSITIIQNIFQ